MKFLSLLGVVLLITGCAGQRLEKSADAAQLATKAVVIVSATSNEEAGRRANAIFYMDDENFATQVHLRASESTLGIPRASDFPDLYGNVYVLEVSPGDHFIRNWQIGGDGLRIRPRTPPEPLKFVARAGEITYLGNLHMEVELGKAFFGNSVVAAGYPEVRDRRDIDIPIAEAKNPTIKGLVKADVLPVGPWRLGAEGTRRTIDAMPQPLPLSRPALK